MVISEAGFVANRTGRFERGVRARGEFGRQIILGNAGGLAYARRDQHAMKTKSVLLGLVAIGLGTAGWSAETAAVPATGRVGVYDSRAVAFAHFWSDVRRTERDALVASARQAKEAGDAAREKELRAQIVAEQSRSHLQVFSTAPADEAMAALRERLPALKAELGVDRFVSKWDDAALKDVPAARQIDVTDRLTREFNPDARRQKTLEAMKTKPPLPLEEAKRLLAEGKL